MPPCFISLLLRQLAGWQCTPPEVPQKKHAVLTFAGCLGTEKVTVVAERRLLLPDGGGTRGAGEGNKHRDVTPAGGFLVACHNSNPFSGYLFVSV